MAHNIPFLMTSEALLLVINLSLLHSNAAARTTYLVYMCSSIISIPSVPQLLPVADTLPRGVPYSA